MSKAFAIVAAAGSSQRMNSTQSKVSLALRGKTVLERAVAPFHSLGIPVVVLVRDGDLREIRELLAHFSGVSVIVGGETRGESVSRGLAYLEEQASPDSDSVVLVHDAARCLVSIEVIQRVIAQVLLSGAAVPALPVVDTLKRAEGPIITETVDRRDLYAVQTPQGFRFELLQRAYRSGNLAATDDAGLIEKFAPVSLVEGSPFNIKITRPQDIQIAELYLSLADAGD